MSGLKAIRRRISSVKNTKQITRAMKLVSAAKLRKAQDAALGGRDFARRLNGIVADLIPQLPDDFQHPLLETRTEIKRQRLIVICGERGLCGAFNANVIKAVQGEIGRASVPTEVVAIGRRAVTAGKRQGWEIISSHEGMPEDAREWSLDELVQPSIDAFAAGECDEVVLFSTLFVSAMSQEVNRQILLPFSTSAESSGDEGHREVRYEPNATEIFSGIVPVMVRNQVKQAALESKASEHSARMTAMDAATNNANDLIDKLRLHYNRARQRSITTELIDIVGGAEAVK